MSIVEKLTEGIVRRDLAKEGAALMNKWERTGLLEGLNSEQSKNNMASLLENQAKELLREASLMNAGDVEGFAAVAFPIVRRVFGSLIANDLVSVQPMSLPSGLIFFLDFSFGDKIGGTPSSLDGKLGYQTGDSNSIYGQGVAGSQITGGVNMNSTNEDQQPFGLQWGYTSATGSLTCNQLTGSSGVDAGVAAFNFLTPLVVGQIEGSNSDTLKQICRFDPDIVSGTYINVYALRVDAELSNAKADLTERGLPRLTVVSDTAIDSAGRKHGVVDAADDGISNDMEQVRRLTQWSGSHNDSVSTSNKTILMVFTGSATESADLDASTVTLEFITADNFDATGGATGAVVMGTPWGLEATENIPEIEIKVDSVSVTARTKKLKAKWSPELGQDLNAYHNLDAEVELTSILSEQIALEIDREILGDLIQGSTAATYYWSRSPGLFVNKLTGAELGAASAAPDFTGTVSEWYETLIETINDVSAQIHRKTLRGGANFVVCSPEVANILEFTSGFRAKVSHEDEKGQIGAVNVGSISKKFDVMVDPYFPRNAVLVGRKGNSFLESGYVYAPYVPLQVTPTIFGTEDFVPRKGVMTRYAKKMVRPDMYGMVIVRGLLGEEGAS